MSILYARVNTPVIHFNAIQLQRGSKSDYNHACDSWPLSNTVRLSALVSCYMITSTIVILFCVCIPHTGPPLPKLLLA